MQNLINSFFRIPGLAGHFARFFFPTKIPAMVFCWIRLDSLVFFGFRIGEFPPLFFCDACLKNSALYIYNLGVNHVKAICFMWISHNFGVIYRYIIWIPWWGKFRLLKDIAESNLAKMVGTFQEFGAWSMPHPRTLDMTLSVLLLFKILPAPFKASHKQK